MADAVLFIASDRSRFITGEALNVSGGIRERLGHAFLIEPGGRVDLKGKGPTDIYHLRRRR